MSSINPVTVLIVDDTPDNLKFLGALLDSNGYEVVAALSGDDALTYLGTNDEMPDLILLDVMMPGMDGFEVCRRLKADDKTRNIPVVYLTAKTETEDIVKGFQTGAIDYVLKPFNAKELLVRIETHVELKRARERIEQDRIEIKNLNTSLQETNRELETLNVSLEAIVAERTEELEKANKRLKVLDAQKMDFLRYLSHEMNTPLNFISAARTFDKDDMSDFNKELVEIVEMGFFRLNDFVKEVISYFELAEEHIGNSKENVYLNDLCKKICQDMRPLAREKNVSFTMAADAPVQVKANKSYLHELVSTLMENAIVYSTPDSQVDIKISHEKSFPVLRITDRGKGIKEEYLETIFKPFVISEHERHEDGYGLSLSKARVIARTHGWSLYAESTGLGSGASFVVVFE